MHSGPWTSPFGSYDMFAVRTDLLRACRAVGLRSAQTHIRRVGRARSKRRSVDRLSVVKSADITGRLQAAQRRYGYVAAHSHSTVSYRIREPFELGGSPR